MLGRIYFTLSKDLSIINAWNNVTPKIKLIIESMKTEKFEDIGLIRSHKPKNAS